VRLARQIERAAGSGAGAPASAAMRVSRLLVLVLASLAALPPARSASSSGRDGNTDERLIGWLGEVERPAAETSGEAALVDTDGDGEPETRKQWIEQIATAPRAYVWHGFMSPEECDHVIAVAEPLMERSGVVDAKTGAPTVDPIRTSYGAFVPIAFDEVVERIEKRAAEWAMVPVTHQEQLHVLRYAEGQQYKDHHDAFDVAVQEKIAFDNGRQRIATVLMYLADVEEGGETVFPHPSARWSDTADITGGGQKWSACASRGPAVAPKKGDALLFYDLDLKGLFDDAALHAGCPVIVGTKWTATKWIHEEPYHNPKFRAAGCADDPENAVQCPGWAAAGECDANPAFMVGTKTNPGGCVSSCCGGPGARERVWLDFASAKHTHRAMCELCAKDPEQ
jgi:prolyl 4-hydroxylase